MKDVKNNPLVRIMRKLIWPSITQQDWLTTKKFSYLKKRAMTVKFLVLAVVGLKARGTNCKGLSTKTAVNTDQHLV